MRGYVDVNVSIDVDEVLNDIETADLLEELHQRGEQTPDMMPGFRSDFIDLLDVYRNPDNMPSNEFIKEFEKFAKRYLPEAVIYL